MKVILTGFMASGKSSVGHRLAQKLNCHYTDLDEVIEATAGKDIPRIFADDGEQVFRNMENQQLRRVIGQAGVLATGGGTPVRTDNQQLLLASPALVVLLEASPAVIADRLRQQSGRPLGDKLDESGIAKLQKERAAAYHRVANLVIHTDQLDVDAICDKILAQIN